MFDTVFQEYSALLYCLAFFTFVNLGFVFWILCRLSTTNKYLYDIGKLIGHYGDETNSLLKAIGKIVKNK